MADLIEPTGPTRPYSYPSKRAVVATGDLQRVIEVDINIETTKNSIIKLKIIN